MLQLEVPARRMVLHHMVELKGTCMVWIGGIANNDAIREGDDMK